MVKYKYFNNNQMDRFKCLKKNANSRSLFIISEYPEKTYSSKMMEKIWNYGGKYKKSA